MQGDMNKITEEYQTGLERLFRAHEEQMAKAQASYESAVEEAKKQFEYLINGATSEKKKEREAPLAVWTKSPNGEDVLILNREAAVMQMALLDQLADVLAELMKLAPSKR